MKIQKKKIQHSTKLNAHLASNKTRAGKEQNTKNNHKWNWTRHQLADKGIKSYYNWSRDREDKNIKQKQWKIKKRAKSHFKR